MTTWPEAIAAVAVSAITVIAPLYAREWRLRRRFQAESLRPRPRIDDVETIELEYKAERYFRDGAPLGATREIERAEVLLAVKRWLNARKER